MLLPDSASKTTAGIAAYITANFTVAKDRSRAIFIWVANHIEYDVANMFAINFYETEADKINKPLATGKGICENYAAVFNDVCHKCGIRVTWWKVIQNKRGLQTTFHTRDALLL